MQKITLSLDIALSLVYLLHSSDPIDLSTARPKLRLDGPALLDHLLYPLINHAYANL